MKEIYIYDYDYDESIRFLSALFNDFGAINESGNLYNRSFSRSAIQKAIRASDRVWLLGHGYKTGLYSKPLEYASMNFDRNLICDKDVDALRGKECIGIWCYAKDFAEKYKLKGLFTGMIISEQIESDWIFNEVPPKSLLDMYNKAFVENLKFCLENYELRDIPAKMRELCPDDHPINVFNYENIFYYE